MYDVDCVECEMLIVHCAHFVSHVGGSWSVQELSVACLVCLFLFYQADSKMKAVTASLRLKKSDKYATDC